MSELPNGLTEVLLRLRADHDDEPVYSTENGVPHLDERAERDGHVHDPRRVEFLRQHFSAAHAALSAGVDRAGYVVWSFMDNFEWAAGYAPRSGLTFIDHATLERTPKGSFAFYAEVTGIERGPGGGPRGGWVSSP